MVNSNNDLPSIIDINCLGKLSLLCGHSLEPEPPHKITALAYFTYKFFDFAKKLGN